MRVVLDTNSREDEMSSTAGTRRKPKSTPHKTSALHALRTSGLAGMFAGSPDLASSRKRNLKQKLRGKPSRLPDLTVFRASIKVRGKPTSQLVIEKRRKARY